MADTDSNSSSGIRPVAAVERRRLLVVEDNDDHRRELMRELGGRGWIVECARTLRDAVELARRHRPHAIVTELVLPDVRDYRFAAQLRRAVAEDVTIVAVTRLPELVFESARRAGFDDVLAKPVAIDALQLRIELPRAG
jgi:CheY-like chemotaxis protein